MSTTKVDQPTSEVRFGMERVDITPPIGIYHRHWGAGSHDRATGIHRPMVADVMTFAPIGGAAPPVVRAHLDLCGLAQCQQDVLVKALADAGGLPTENVILMHSHTHSSGWFTPDRIGLPGGDLINSYLNELRVKVTGACSRALAAMQKATITYAFGRCSLAANRDYWDARAGEYVCGFNPDSPADDTVVVARISDENGRIVATVINYACHPTTLGWDNSLLSPDFVGALREVIQNITGAPAVYAQGASGDLGPRHGFLGDTSIADKNGRQLAFAALSALESMGPPGTDFEYCGPVISGATVGVWSYAALRRDRQVQTARFACAVGTVHLPLKPKPDLLDLQREKEHWEERQRESVARGELLAARGFGARAERARRWIIRLSDVPEGGTFPLTFSVHRMGDAVWAATGAEPYNLIQVELRRRFPELTILFSPLQGDALTAYLLPADLYGKGVYQEMPSTLAPGCLEILIDAVTTQIAALA